MIFVRIRQHFLALIGVSLNVRACNEPQQIQHQNEKKRLKRHRNCALAVRRSQNFLPRCKPPSWGAWRPKFNQLEWSLPSPTEDTVLWRSMHTISSYCGNRSTNTHNARPPARCKQTGPITIHCAAHSVFSIDKLNIWTNRKTTEVEQRLKYKPNP